MSEANRELVRRQLEELFNRRNLDACDDLTAMLQARPGASGRTAVLSPWRRRRR